MARSLRVSPNRTLPLQFLSLRKVVFGGSGSGKTSSGRVLFEEATEAGVLCGAIDLKGDWYGLKSSATGKRAGIPVVIFGGEHQDVPLDEAGGASLAEIVVDLQQPFILDLEMLSKGKQLRFLGAFFDRLYDKNREPLVLFCDEADRYAPQKPMSPEANICLAATEDIAKRGRSHGIFPVFLTQRPASLNKDVSELCDVAMVFRTPGPRNQQAVEDWFSSNATAKERDEVTEKLAGLATGTAIVCSAHPDFRLFDMIHWRRPETFDSSATPEIGKRRLQPKRLAQPDLEKIKARMAATIAKAKADDPKALRAKIAQLEREIETHPLLLRKGDGPIQKIKEIAVKIPVPVIRNGAVKRLDAIASKMIREATKHGKAMAMFWEQQEGCWKEVTDTLRAAVTAAQQVPTRLAPIYERSPDPPHQVRRIRYGGRTSDPAIVPIQSGRALDQKILDALAWWRAAGIECPTRQQVSFVVRRSVGGHFNNTISRLHTNLLIAYPAPNRLTLTREGQTKAHPVMTVPTAGALIEMIRQMLGSDLKRQIFDVLVDAGKPVTREEVSQRLGRTIGGHFNNSVSRLSSLGIVRYPSPGMLALSDLVMEPNFA